MVKKYNYVTSWKGWDIFFVYCSKSHWRITKTKKGDNDIILSIDLSLKNVPNINSIKEFMDKITVISH